MYYNTLQHLCYGFISLFFFVMLSCDDRPSLNTNEREVAVDSIQWNRTDSLYTLAKNLYRERNFQEASAVFNSLPGEYFKQGRYELYFMSLRNKSVNERALFKPEDSILGLLESGLSNVNKVPSNSMALHAYYKVVASAYSRDGNYSDAKYYGELALNISLDSLNRDHPDQFEAEMQIYDLLSTIEQNMFNYQQAEKYTLLQLEKDRSAVKRTGDYVDLLAIYLDAKEYEKLEVLLDTVSWKERLPATSFYEQYVFHMNKLDYLMAIEEEDRALETAGELQKLINNSPYGAHFSDWFLNQRMYQLHFANGNFKEVIALIEKNKTNDAPTDYLRLVSIDLRWLSRAHFFDGNHEQAKEYILQAINRHLPRADHTNDFFETPSLDNASFKEHLIENLNVKAEIAAALYNETNDIRYLEVAIASYESTHELLKKVGFESTEDGFLNALSFDTLYDKYLDLIYRQWNDNPSEALFYRALTVCDESRNLAILKELNRSRRSRLFKNIPSSVKEKQQRLETALDSILVAPGDERISRRRDSLEQELNTFKKELSTKYPNYYALMYGNSKSLREIVASDLADYSIVEYIETEDYFYIFSIQNSEIKLSRVPISEMLQQQLERFITNLRDPSNDEYMSDTSALYNTFLDGHFNAHSKTVLVLDGVLNKIPFEVLMDGTGMLLEKTSVLRKNSLLGSTDVGTSEVSGAIAFAPFASEGGDSGSRISSSREEVDFVKQSFGGDKRLDADASKKAFIESSGGYPVIHLATHSEVDRQSPLHSAVFFSEVDTEKPSDYTLQLEELYSLSLDADLVTLSSCETGLGKEVKGKGVQSISNAFNYAGVASTVMSLWKVPDKETGKIMQFFYSHLSEGMPKDEALRSAKLDYLGTTSDPALRHPYYWAGFVISGDASPLATSTPGSTNWLWYLAGALVLVLVVWGTRNKQRHRRKTA